MTSRPTTNPPLRMPGGIAVRLFRVLASLRLAVPLIALLAAVLACATFFDAAKGADYAQWYFYHSWWFLLIIGLVAANILASTLIRFPWGKRRIGFLITHAGLLVLLAGSVRTLVSGLSGQLSLAEGETANSILLDDRCEFRAQWRGQRSAAAPPPVAFGFTPGPGDWPEGKTLDFGEFGGLGLRVLKFYRQAGIEEDWIADPRRSGGPALKLTVAGPDGRILQEAWLAADPSRSEVFLGPVRLTLQRASLGSMLDDFLKPPTGGADQGGVLSIHHQGQAYRVDVGKSIGKKIALGDGKTSVELVKYLPNAVPIPGARPGEFESRGNKPENPLVELRVYQPGKDQPVREIAFANSPFLSLSGIHGRDQPVQFWYHHPALTPQSGVEFLRAPDGKLYCRVARDGKYEPRGEVGIGKPMEIPGQFALSVTEYVPCASRRETFSPMESGPGESGRAEPAALVEITVAEEPQELWLRRNDPEHGLRTIKTPEGLLVVSFANERRRLDFSLELLSFRRGLYPGGTRDASYSSLVRLVDKARGIDEEHEISMNHPLSYGGFSFYQADFQAMAGGKAASVLKVAYDPGRLLKYVGSAMLCLGISLMFLSKYRFLQKTASYIARWRSKGAAPPSSHQDDGRTLRVVTGIETEQPAAADLRKVG